MLLAPQALLPFIPLEGMRTPPLCLQPGALGTLRFVLGGHPEGQVLVPGGYQDKNVSTTQISINLENLEVSGEPEYVLRLCLEPQPRV